MPFQIGVTDPATTLDRAQRIRGAPPDLRTRQVFCVAGRKGRGNFQLLSDFRRAFKKRNGQTHRVWVREHCVRRHCEARLDFVSVASRVSEPSKVSITTGLCGPPMKICPSNWERWSGGMRTMKSSLRARAKFSASSVRRFIASVRHSASCHYRRSIIASSG